MADGKGTNITAVAQYLILGAIIYFAFMLLKKFNLLPGDNKNTADAKALGTDAAFKDTVTNITKNNGNPFLPAIVKKFGKKPTKAQMESLIPNKKNFPKLMTQIIDAHNNFSQNDAAKIFGAYKQLSSQYEINFFNSVMSIAQKKDVYGSLDQLMHDSDMSKLRDIIEAKPVI